MVTKEEELMSGEMTKSTKKPIPEGPMVTNENLFHLHVCVPEGWTDDQIVKFANRERLCGTTNGWQIHREADYKDGEGHERVPCDGRVGYVHVILDA
jgi:hypothetical protein